MKPYIYQHCAKINTLFNNFQPYCAKFNIVDFENPFIIILTKIFSQIITVQNAVQKYEQKS